MKSREYALPTPVSASAPVYTIDVPGTRADAGMHVVQPTCSTVQLVEPGDKITVTSSKSKLMMYAMVVMLIVMAIVVLVLVLVLTSSTSEATDEVGTHSSSASHGQDQAGNRVCLTEGCVHAASQMLRSMDSSADPCSDFYQYACGGWLKNTLLPDDKSKYYTFSKLDETVQNQLKGLLERNISEADTEASRKTKYFYRSCNNATAVEQLGAEPLTTLLTQLGGWPVLKGSAWSDDDLDMTNILTKLQLLGVQTIITHYVSAGIKDSNTNIIQIDQTSLGLPSRDYFTKRPRNDSVLKAYQEYAVRVAVLLGGELYRATVDMRDMIDFEIELANITTPAEERRDIEAIYQKLTIAELQDNITSIIDWSHYFNGLFGEVDIQLNDSEPVISYGTPYLMKLDELLAGGSPRVFANYVIWRLILRYHSALPERFADARKEFIKALYGISAQPPRWRRCVDMTHYYYGMSVGRMFVEEHFEQHAKHDMIEMIENLKASFIHLLDSNEWMDEETRQVAIEKVNYMQGKIAYPDYIFNTTLLNSLYDSLNVSEREYFLNLLRHRREAVKTSYRKLRQKVNKDTWFAAPAVVNAFYHPLRNQIMFPAGILQPPFYHPQYPKSLNYGGIGMVIGHEITHGFDDQGRQFDKHGNAKQWWADDVIDAFKKKAQCIIDQYSNYTVPSVNLNLNGRLTQGENIADNGGLKQSYQAYRSWVKARGREEDLLPGVSLNHDQLFFLNFGQIWCAHIRPESYIHAIATNPHSPAEFRVIGSLSNSPDFARAYNCPVGSPLNPQKKCSVW